MVLDWTIRSIAISPKILVALIFLFGKDPLNPSWMSVGLGLRIRTNEKKLGRFYTTTILPLARALGSCWSQKSSTFEIKIALLLWSCLVEQFITLNLNEKAREVWRRESLLGFDKECYPRWNSFDSPFKRAIICRCRNSEAKRSPWCQYVLVCEHQAIWSLKMRFRGRI
jgi:hypothetical protein